MSSTDTPRYLFRTYSPGSEGSNGASGFLSTADCNSFSEARSLDHVSPRNARDILRDHITWQCPADDTLISFTSSFLFALQHAIRKIATCRRGTTEENCFISIIDTSKYPPGTFLSTLSLLEKYKLDETTDKFLLHEYHAAEYLAEDELSMLQGSSIHVSFATIISEGNLFSIVPELNVEAHKRKLIKRLEQLRLLWYYRERAITTQDIDKARKLALCFGDKWVPVIMIWALAMKARPQGVGLLEEEFADGFHGEITTPFLFQHPKTEIPAILKELAQRQQTMSRAYDAQIRTKLQGTGVHTPPEDGTCDDLTGMLESIKI